MVGNLIMSKYVIVFDAANFAYTTSLHSPTSAVEISELRIRASVGTSVSNNTMYAKSGCYEVL
jgi:hypothetical protein